MTAAGTLTPESGEIDFSALLRDVHATPKKAASILDSLSSSSKLLWASEHENPETLLFSFASRGVPKQLFRWTGWNASIKSEAGDYTDGLSTVARAFQNVKGFHFYNGTQIRNLSDGSIIPSVTDVPAALNKIDPEIILLGIIPKVHEEPKLSAEFGLVLKVNEQKGFFTVVNPASDISYVLQPDVNRRHEWLKEAEESFRISTRLAEKGWTANLIVYGGTTSGSGQKPSIVESELLGWSKASKNFPNLNINIILIKGSGGVADKYSTDSEFLAQNPKVKVITLDTEKIQEALASITKN